MTETIATKRFDQRLIELETIVAQLETGELSLEEALAAFEAGVALVRELNQRLSEAEGRVEILTRDTSGTLRLQTLEREPESKD